MTLTLYKRNEVVTDSQGNGQSGIRIAVASQPANTSVFPPTPAWPIYSDSTGQNQITNGYVDTDGNGMASYYLLPGIYTVCYHSPRIDAPGQQIVLPDQIVVPPSVGVPQWNSDSSANGTLVGLVNGDNQQFSLSTLPDPINSLIFLVNGIAQTGYSLYHPTATITLPVAPQPGDVLSAVYQITTIA